MTKTMLITGSSSGVGFATAKLFAERGFNVIATMRNTDNAPDFGGLSNLIVERLDVEDTGSIEHAINVGLQHFGQIDLVINNAGYGQYGIFENLPLEKIRKNYEVNVFGVMNVMQKIIPIFRQQGEGTILNVSSCGGLIAIPASSSYISTKFAIEGFSESVYHELASQNINIKLFEPGGILTPFHKRSANESTGNGGATVYDAFIAQHNENLIKISAGVATPEKTAEDIYAAATDGTNRLRYCSPYGVEHIVNAKRTLSDEGYEAFIRTQFPLPL
ncbi:SDR family oxidoreductase [Serratia marcescens]|uniref:SDR family oxidoreductase n=1 Tax=Serratia marcescens TaxID=615 RepID=UPI0028534218|nr:SDR family oxidoreductase [Serratia marcescens]MDR4885901.1 SDR family oxidoreductase [Serratia marcescens]